MDDASNQDLSSYGIVASGPPVNPAEVESEETALEVVVMWGTEAVLHVAHLPRGRSFTVGEDGGTDSVSFLVPREVIGAERLELARVAEDGAVELRLPAHGKGELVHGGALVPFGAGTHALRDGATARLGIGAFVFVVRRVKAGRRLAVGGAFDRRPWAYLGATAGVTGLVLALFHLAPPVSSALAVSDVTTGSRLVEFAIQANAFEPEPAPVAADSASGGESGEASVGPEGQAGDATAERTTNRAGVRGPRDSEVTQLARDASEYIQTTGVIGALRAMAFAGAPTSPFGADQAIGSDAANAIGALLGAQVGANYGIGGLGLRGTGRGGLGDAFGTFGLGDFGTHRGDGHGPGTGHGDGPGGPGLHDRVSRGPSIDPLPPQVQNPGLSADVIRRVVRRHLNEVRFCYEQGLQRRSDLEGRVVTRFFIQPTGAVGAAVVSPEGSSLTDGAVRSCVTDTVRRWSFPAPDNGQIVTVTYPFSFRSN